MKRVNKKSALAKKLDNELEETTPEEWIVGGVGAMGLGAFSTHRYHKIIQEVKADKAAQKSQIRNAKRTEQEARRAAQQYEQAGQESAMLGREPRKLAPDQLASGAKVNPNAGTELVRWTRPSNTPPVVVHNLRYADYRVRHMTSGERAAHREAAEQAYAHADDLRASARFAAYSQRDARKALWGDRAFSGLFHTGRAISAGTVAIGAAEVGYGFYLRRRNGKTEKVRMPKRSRTGQ